MARVTSSRVGEFFKKLFGSDDASDERPED